MEGPVEGPVVDQAMFVANLYQAKGSNRVLDVVLQAMPIHLAAASPLLHHGHMLIVPISLHPHFVTQYHFIQIVRLSSSIGTHIERVQISKDYWTIWVKWMFVVPTVVLCTGRGRNLQIHESIIHILALAVCKEKLYFPTHFPHLHCSNVSSRCMLTPHMNQKRSRPKLESFAQTFVATMLHLHSSHVACMSMMVS
jgi:hypothetical protein